MNTDQHTEPVPRIGRAEFGREFSIILRLIHALKSAGFGLKEIDDLATGCKEEKYQLELSRLLAMVMGIHFEDPRNIINLLKDPAPIKGADLITTLDMRIGVFNVENSPLSSLGNRRIMFCRAKGTAVTNGVFNPRGLVPNLDIGITNLNQRFAEWLDMSGQARDTFRYLLENSGYEYIENPGTWRAPFAVSTVRRVFFLGTLWKKDDPAQLTRMTLPPVILCKAFVRDAPKSDSWRLETTQVPCGAWSEEDLIAILAPSIPM